MSMGSRQEVVERLRRKYQGAGPGYRRNLINELCSVGGYERKYAIKVLNGKRSGPRGRRRGGSRPRYGPAEAEVIAAIWKLGDYPCGKRLVAMLPLWIPAYEQRHGVCRPPCGVTSIRSVRRRWTACWPRGGCTWSNDWAGPSRSAVALPDSRTVRKLGH